jgi:2-methylisocitrate lyase-like PEP mutase family enzyme
MNFKIGLYPISTLQIAAKSMYDVLKLLKETDTTMKLKSKMTTYSEIMKSLNYYEDVEKYSNFYK